MDIIKQIAKELKIKENQVTKTVELIDQDNTIPFIARYRKEVTGNLTDEILRELDEKLKYYRNLESRKEDVIRLIEEQEKLTDELENKINSAMTLTEVEDLYLPFKKKKTTRASIAEEKGFGPLAEYIIKSEGTVEELETFIDSFIGEEAEDRETSINYAKDIIAGQISEDAELRGYIREKAFKTAGIRTEAGKNAEEKGVYSNYFSYAERISTIKAHRILAINRGEEEGQLKVYVDLDDVNNLIYIREKYNPNKRDGFSKILDEALIDSYKRLIEPSISNQIKSTLKEYADEESIEVFADNLRPYIMQNPIKGKVVMGLDPGFRTGCKVAIVSEFGEYLDSAQIFPTQSKKMVAQAKEVLKDFIEKYKVDIIAIGNGTASRETESFVVDLLREGNFNTSYVIVSESGASIYSASKLGQEEFPDLDVTIRGAISIARRIQDPMAELVKIEPKHIGVGQYQHDVNQKKLDESLEAVVESCVNQVGVDVNNASAALLEYVSGISKKIAKNIIDYKNEKGLIKSKKEIGKVKGIGPKTFEQCAGFLRVPESDNPLDNTGVHPESYKAATALLDDNLDDINIKEKAEELGIGELTLADIIEELKKPGRDPREEMPEVVLRSDILTMDDLKIGTRLKGTVRNVVDFGAFVDIGVGTDGLVHVSEISDRYVKHPSDAVTVGDIVDVRVIEIDKVKDRIGLSMKK